MIINDDFFRKPSREVDKKLEANESYKEARAKLETDEKLRELSGS